MTTIEPSRRTRFPDRSLLERLLDCTGEREQTLLDENGHFADEIHRLAALLEDTRVPFDAIGQLVDSALVGIGAVLKLTQLENRGSDLVGKLLLFARIPLDPLHHFAALVIEGFEQSRKDQFRLLLPFGFGARDGVCDALLRVIERRVAASRSTKSFIVASSSQTFPTSSMDGPAHTAATEISGPLIWLHGQSGKRGSAASDVPRKASSTATAMATDQHLMRRPQALRAAREILARDRTRESRRP